MKTKSEQENLYQSHLGNGDLLEAESMVLGAVLLEADIIHEITLEPEHFSSSRNKLIFKAMRELASEGTAIDPSILVNKLKSDIENIGGTTYLTDLALACPTATNIEFYQNIVFEQYKKRTLVASAAAFLNNQSEESADDFYKTYVEMQEIGIKSERTKNDVLMEIYDDMMVDKGEMTGIDTGFTDLNNMTGGLNGGDLIIIAGRPSMGKTAFALNLVKSCCENSGVADIFSLEMPEKQLTQRLLSSIGNISGIKWKNPYRMFSKLDSERASEAIGIYSKWHINIHDSSKQTIADIRARVRKTQREHKNEKHIVVIDYLQLITQVGKFERNDLAIGDITKQLKQMARQFNIPVILLSQLNRGVEQRQDKRPMMSDLRDSGSIEQDADLIMFLYRDDYYDKQSENRNIVEVNLAKHRNGPVGTIQLAFVKEYSQFLDLELRREVAQ
ncbi:replicative DNA helicase [Bacillus chungangensis]|uniref:Replicative DNA helicase n=1 Tax=Bacillus chungangensis TaxID=587633 RepID=A0ABT9WS20_9BACI|nr:replicative DNA helicase [Bacillus chungangensis]MDQ0176024.1 replicative DNA helicase [Bacillus chungangensis]